MKAAVLQCKGDIALKDMPIQGEMGPKSVRIGVKNVGICGSDVHYYLHGRIGPYVIEKPMILGHEASGEVLEVGAGVHSLMPGDRVCMEPGIPNPASRATRMGLYNLDPEVVFWATPPVHGCLVEEVIHPEEFTFKLPDSVGFAEGAMIEPLAIGLQAAKKARIAPGDTAVVVGAGTIGIMCALSLVAGGCARVFVTDNKPEKLAVAAGCRGVVPIDIGVENPVRRVLDATDGWGAEVVVEASGADAVYPGLHEYACPGARAVLVGIPAALAPFDIAGMQAKELELATVFRYAHMYPRAIGLVASGAIDVGRLIGKVYPFEQTVAAFEHAARADSGIVKIQIAF